MSLAPASAVVAVSSSSLSPAPSRPGMIQQAAVLGAGTMGVRIAAHLANAGIPVVLLDLAGDAGKGIAQVALENLSRAKPAAFYDPASLRLIQPGTFDHDLGLLSKCDWVLEAVTENLAIKREILAKIAPPSQARSHPHHQHQRSARSQHRRAAAPCTPPLLVRHPLLQPSALHAPARGHPYT
jgi:3-hydroxyacyl-CoA dehydrogenase-like protein